MFRNGTVSRGPGAKCGRFAKAHVWPSVSSGRGDLCAATRAGVN